jgi:hypothetical protein
MFSNFGADLGNGTYSGAVGEMQNGAYDMITSYSGRTANTYNLYLGPIFGQTHFAILIKRQADHVAINTNGLMAGINVDVYCLLFVAMFCIAAIAFINEKTEHSSRNSIWRICSSLLPSNTAALKYQSGYTRRVVVITCGVIMLLSTTYYQSKLLQMLLISETPLKSDINDVARNIETFKSKMYSFSTLHEFINNSKLQQFQNALNINPPELRIPVDLRNDIIDNNAVYLNEISFIIQKLSQLPPRECANYDVILLPQIMHIWMCLMVRNERRDLLEPFNVIIAERMDFINNLPDKPQMSEECMNYVFPRDIGANQFVSLSIYSLSGAFALLLILLALSIFVFLAEFLASKTCSVKTTTEAIVMENDLINEFDRFISEKLRDKIVYEHKENFTNKYRAFRDAIILGMK